MRLTTTIKNRYWFIMAASIGAWQWAHAEESAVKIATQLTNPLAYLDSVLFQYNYDDGLGINRNGIFQYLEIQPSIPAHINKDWHYISHMVLPVLWEHNIVFNTNTKRVKADVDGLGDFQYAGFFAPSHPIAPGTFWGLGPYVSLPTATKRDLGFQQYLAGLSAVILQQRHGWTYGILAEQAWEVEKTRRVIIQQSATQLYVQPFVNYVTSTSWTYSLNSESTYFWNLETHNKWSVPINAMVLKLINFGQWAMSVEVGIRYWAESPMPQIHHFGARAGITLAFPEQNKKPA